MSTPYVLTLVDLSGIQAYVFGSNRLAENIGASALVEQATHHWPLEIARDLAHSRERDHNIILRDGVPQIDPTITIGPEVAVEVLYTGGGNVVLLFADIKLAHAFATRYTTRLITHAPGLEAALVHQEVAWDAAAAAANGASEAPNFRQAWQIAWRNLAIRKANRPRSTPLLGLSVTAACAATGLPATDYDPLALDPAREGGRRFRTLSAELIAKLDKETQAWSNRRLIELIPELRRAGFEFWYNLDMSDPELAGDGQGAYVAVVHADGNDMGQRFATLIAQATSDRQAVRLLRTLSTLVNESGKEALRDCSRTLLKAWQEESQTVAGVVKLPAPKTMPFRPLVFGGDDMTFVCEGRLGLDLAVVFLRAFEGHCRAQLTQADELRSVLPERYHHFAACAGVAMVKAHYPFARAYDLSARLSQNAKAYVRKQRQEQVSGDESSFSALDWHVVATSFYGDIKTLRDQELQTPFGALFVRPLRLYPTEGDWCNWGRFRYALRTFQEGKLWRNSHNKVVGLRASLRAGPQAVRRYRHAYQLARLPELSPLEPSLQESGWESAPLRCGYFDMIETLDFLAPLDDPTEDAYDPA